MSGSPVTEPEPAGGTPGRRLALVVAITDYLDSSLRRLRAPAGDAAELRDALADPEIGGFSVTSAVNEKAHQLRVVIEEFLADRHLDDLVLVYLSCHGLVDGRGRLYFAARDTLKHRLASSGIESHWLLEQLEDCRARRQVVILDCCFSGAFARGGKGGEDLGLGERLVGEGRGRVVLTASRGTEYSFEGEPLQGETEPRGSVFTSALVEGIRTGGADTNADGEISVEDAYAYAFERVRHAGTPQTPQRWLFGAEGSILLARTPPPLDRRRDRPPASSPTDSAGSAAASVGPRSATSDARPAAQRGALQSRRRTWLLATVSGCLAAAALVTALVTQAGDDPGPGSEAGGNETADAGSSGTLTQESPWRLRVSGVDVDECNVRLTHQDSGNVYEWSDIYGVKTFQMRESGTFRYQVNDPGCGLLPQQGDGGVSRLPFSWSAPDGDTPVFESPGTVTVRVEDRYGTPTCNLKLLSDSDGRAVDNREAAEDQATVRLESNGPRRVYIAATTCLMKVSAGP